MAWATDDPEHPPPAGSRPVPGTSPTLSPWTGLGRTCSAQCVQGARQLRTGETIEAGSLAEEGEARVRTRRPALATRPVPSAQAQPQGPLLLEIVAWGRKVGQQAQTALPRSPPSYRWGNLSRTGGYLSFFG